MFRNFASYSVFTLLLLNTLASTIVVALVSISALQRVADEHPRRYLSKTLFQYVVDTFPSDQQGRVKVNGLTFEFFPLAALPTTQSDIPFDELLQGVRQDPDGIPIIFHDGRYMAAVIDGDTLVVLPRFGRSLSSQAWVLVSVVVVTVLTVLVLNILSIRHLTKPFSVFRRAVQNVDNGNLSYRVPINKTYGEFRDLANSFNGMLERLEHVNAARRHMLLAIPHEVRTPLARLKVRKDMISEPEIHEAISRDINALEEILETILQTERLQSQEGTIKRSPVPVHSFFQEIVDEFRQQYSDLDLVVKTDEETFHADAFSISLLMKNLISNAIRYGRERPITVTVAQQEREPDTLVLSVSDQGTGIPESQIPYMTEPFWRLDESRQRKSGGYGLGLYLCDTISKSHGGQLIVESKVDEGTTVTVTLREAFVSKQ
ncbi:HAMP domain-containing sensor histidine kinase [uncultured Rhodospira sp.]|uniref:HAMP domain-containing sensor histidine kinase n=1 Tax=uncultured Rhodospira sp. TaxID=1936189 RepID=UPI00263579E7|nr:HAMP domain-containing sensor histidine kinase [uncultured Rhodospira sp.]